MTAMTNQAWVKPAADYAANWLDFQLQRFERVGVQCAVAWRGQIIYQNAHGWANLASKEPLTTQHRFRVASHSKSLTAAGLMRMREQDDIALDTRVGTVIKGLHPQLSQARISDLLSHASGATRDGPDSGQFTDRRDFLSKKQLLADLKQVPPQTPGERLKYSNHGYGLLGMVIEKISTQAFEPWLMQQVIKPFNLTATLPNATALTKTIQFARGHTAKHPFGRYLVPADNDCHAMAPAAGVVSTAHDMAKFFAQLATQRSSSPLELASRRDMQMARLADDYSPEKISYGLGLMLGGSKPADAWFGHTGGFQGVVSRTAHFIDSDLTVSVLCNSNDGLSWVWTDGLFSIFNTFLTHGSPKKHLLSWKDRWWTAWGEYDLLPVGDRLLGISPINTVPIGSTPDEYQVISKDVANIIKMSSFGSQGETLTRIRDRSGKVIGIQRAGAKMLRREAIEAELQLRYGPKVV